MNTHFDLSDDEEETCEPVEEKNPDSGIERLYFCLPPWILIYRNREQEDVPIYEESHAIERAIIDPTYIEDYIEDDD